MMSHTDRERFFSRIALRLRAPPPPKKHTQKKTITKKLGDSFDGFIGRQGSQLIVLSCLVSSRLITHLVTSAACSA